MVLRQRVVSDSIESNIANQVLMAESNELFLYFGTCSRCLLTMFDARPRLTHVEVADRVRSSSFRAGMTVCGLVFAERLRQARCRGHVACLCEDSQSDGTGETGKLKRQR